MFYQDWLQISSLISLISVFFINLTKLPIFHPLEIFLMPRTLFFPKNDVFKFKLLKFVNHPPSKPSVKKNNFDRYNIFYGGSHFINLIFNIHAPKHNSSVENIPDSIVASNGNSQIFVTIFRTFLLIGQVKNIKIVF